MPADFSRASYIRFPTKTIGNDIIEERIEFVRRKISRRTCLSI
jgi:hypothetical protein